MQWEQANPPWELPDYIGDFTRALEETQSWITTGGVTVPATAALLGIDPLPHMQPLILSDGESEVGGSDMELLMPKWLLSKVQWADNVEQVLDKGAWVTTLATCRGGEIFVDVSSWFLPLHS